MLGFLFKKLTQIFRLPGSSSTLSSKPSAIDETSSESSSELISLQDELEQISMDERHFDLASLSMSSDDSMTHSTSISDIELPALIGADRPSEDRQELKGLTHHLDAIYSNISLKQELPNPNRDTDIEHGVYAEYEQTEQQEFIENPLESKDTASVEDLKGLETTLNVHNLDDSQLQQEVQQGTDESYYPPKPSAIKKLKVHGLRSLNKESSRRSKKEVQAAPLILSRSRMNETQVLPQETQHKRAAKVVQDQARLKELEQNFDYAVDLVERNWQADDVQVSTRRLAELDRYKANKQVKIDQQQIKEQQAEIEKEQTREQVSKDFSHTSSSSPAEAKLSVPKVADISLLEDSFNKNLADFARDRYIDYDQVLTDHIKKKS